MATGTNGLTRMFRNQFFGSANGFEPRDWQGECEDAYAASVAAHIERNGRNGSEQHTYTIYAGTGSGKTKTSAMIAAHMLNAGLIRNVVVVCPNRSIKKKTQKDFVTYFGIDLIAAKNGFSRRYIEGIPPARHGYILTYGHLMNDPDLHRKICSYAPTLVIFDEIHHLGDRPDKRWGDASLAAFGSIPFILGLTGTPYRSDNTLIPFVTYEDTEQGGLKRFKAEGSVGYTYNLGRAVADMVCRTPQFMWHTGTVQIRPPQDGAVVTVDFADENVSEYISSARMRGAVTFGSCPRREMLRSALAECRKENRKVVIFLGGDTQGDETPTMDAKELLPSELADFGIGPDEYSIVTGDDEDAQAKIERFGLSDKWILISVNMVSEGVDIPEISAAIFLTSITAKQTTIQRIGRTLRSRGATEPFLTALIFMFADPDLVKMAGEMLAEIKIEQAVRRNRENKAGVGPDGSFRTRTEAIGIAGGDLESVKVGLRTWPAAEFRSAQAALVNAGVSAGLAETALVLIMKEAQRGDARAK